MKILIISGSGRASGGAEKIALTSAARLAGRGHQVTVAAAFGPVAPELQFVENLTVKLADPNPMPERPGFTQRIKMVWPRGIESFFEEILTDLQNSADSLIHFHNGYFEFSVPGFRAIAKSKIPVVYTHHDYGWACPLTGFFDYTDKKHCNLVGGSVGCLSKDCTNSQIEKLIRYSRHFGTHQTSGIGKAVKGHIFISRTAYEKLSPYIDPKTSHSFLPNPTEFQQKRRTETQPDSELIFVGRLTFEKDPLALADAAESAGMSVNYVGDGDLRERLREKVGDQAVRGWKSPAETAELVRASRGLVLPSRWLEVAPLVIFEAAALGIPVVVPSDTAAAEFVDHEKTGLIYERTTKYGLVEAISRLKDENFADNLGAEAYRRFWLDPPTWSKHLDGLEAIYRRAIGQG